MANDFDEVAALKEAEDAVRYRDNIPPEMEQFAAYPKTISAFIEGARWQHSLMQERLEELELRWKNASMVCSRMWAQSKRENKQEATIKIAETYEKARHLLYVGSILRTQEVDWEKFEDQQWQDLEQTNAQLSATCERYRSALIHVSDLFTKHKMYKSDHGEQMRVTEVVQVTEALESGERSE